MSSPFPFIPRVVSKSKRKLPHNVPESLDSEQTSTAATPSRQTAAWGSSSPSGVTGLTENKSGKDKAGFSNQDYKILFSLALSNYALWTDPDLRQQLEMEGSNNDSLSGHDGQRAERFISLSYLLNHSKVLAPLELGGLQAPIIKALRAVATDAFEVRLLITDPSPSTWSSNRKTLKEDAGAYEIRRKDWDEPPVQHPQRQLTKADWDSQTVYVERIPVKYRTIPAVARFVSALLATRSSTISARIEGIILLPHHMDRPDDAPTCKGFALVVLGDNEDVESLLERWPWDGRPGAVTQGDAAVPINVEGSVTKAEVREADQFGFRVLSKLRWSKLKEEYLSYRSKLVSEINAHEYANRHAERARTASPEPPLQPDEEDVSVERKQPDTVTFALDPSSPYPFNCLVFVRHIHTETNKTTLRKLFNTAFLSSIAGGESLSDGIDYVDFNKGLDSCHLRLATHHHASTLVQHFREHPTLQTSGLDETGSPPADGSPHAIAMEVVTGKREEIYWQKVPEKIRRQAVQKAIASMELSLSSSSSGPSADPRNGNGGTGGGGGKDQREGIKRRKK